MRCPHFQYVCGWYQEGDQPFSQEFNHSCLKLWRIFWTVLSAVSMSGTCVAEVLLPFVWHIRQQSRVGTIWDPLAWFLHIYSDLGQWHGSGSVDKQCNSSEVSSGDITGSSPPCGRYCVVDPAVPLLSCVCGCGPLYALHVWWNHVG